MITAMTLKKSCIVAPAKARLNSSLLRIDPSDTIVLVIVVPMLAPRIIGTAASTVSVPEPTSPTIVDVEADEDCTRTVARIPANSPATGLSTLSRSPSWKSAPSALIPASSDATPTRNRYSRPTTRAAFTQGGDKRRSNAAFSANPLSRGSSEPRSRARVPVRRESHGASARSGAPTRPARSLAAPACRDAIRSRRSAWNVSRAAGAIKRERSAVRLAASVKPPPATAIQGQVRRYPTRYGSPSSPSRMLRPPAGDR